MNETVKEILVILETGRTEVQVAAAQILGELRIKDPAVVRALGNGAARSSVLGRYALEALARINTVDSLRLVVRILCEHDSLTDQAIHLLNEAGTAAHPAVSKNRPSNAILALHRSFGLTSCRRQTRRICIELPIDFFAHRDPHGVVQLPVRRL